MNKVQIWGGVVCVSVFLATGALAEILGVQPGTSGNPKDNVPQEIQRSTPGGGTFGQGGTGPGTRSDALTGEMEKEKPEPFTRQELEQNVEKTHGGGAALAAEDLNEKSKNTSKTSMKSNHGGTTDASDTANGGPKTERQMFQQQNSDTTAQGQQLINTQPQEKQ
jgi:hypothetical protein